VKSKPLILVALAIDILIVITKFIAAAITGSSAMLSEGIHSVIDATSQLLLLLGMKKSNKRADQRRPFGYGRELFFWSFIVSLIIFIVGGCVSCYEGIIRLKEPPSTGSPTINYIVLGVSFVFICIPAVTALRSFNKERGKEHFWKAFRESRNPSIFITLLSDIGDLTGILIAFAGVYLSHRFQDPVYDGVASILIGIVLIIISIMLVMESKSLLMGESVSRKTMQQIIALAETDPAVLKVKKHFSIYLAPEEIVLQMIIGFKRNLTAHEITVSISRLNGQIKQAFPRIKQIFIEPQLID
jgi:cation diffusion facilitator family transporter